MLKSLEKNGSIMSIIWRKYTLTEMMISCNYAKSTLACCPMVIPPVGSLLLLREGRCTLDYFLIFFVAIFDMHATIYVLSSYATIIYDSNS